MEPINRNKKQFRLLLPREIPPYLNAVGRKRNSGKTQSAASTNQIHPSYVYRFKGSVTEIPAEVLKREKYEFLVLDLDWFLRGLFHYSIPRIDTLLSRLIRGQGLNMAFPKETIEWIDQCIKQELSLVILTDNFTFRRKVTHLKIGEHLIPVVAKAHKPSKEPFNTSLELISCQSKERYKGCILGDSRKEAILGLQEGMDTFHVQHTANPFFKAICFILTHWRQNRFFQKVNNEQPNRVVELHPDNITSFSRPNVQ